MRFDSTCADEAEFLVEPLPMSGVVTMAAEAGFCDGCSGCKVRIGSASRLVTVAVEPSCEDGDFLVQPLALPSTLGENAEGWCSGCKGCSAACRSRIH